jgi:hypothetical protein
VEMNANAALYDAIAISLRGIQPFNPRLLVGLLRLQPGGLEILLLAGDNC